jgi:hypothetical protein
MAILMGVAPNLFLKPMEPAVRRAIEQIVGTPGPLNAAVPGTVPRTVTAAGAPAAVAASEPATAAPAAASSLSPR